MSTIHSRSTLLVTIALFTVACGAAGDDDVVAHRDRASTVDEPAGEAKAPVDPPKADEPTATTSQLCGAGTVETGDVDASGSAICTEAPGTPIEQPAIPAGANGVASSAPLVFREVLGWPNWECADLGQNASGTLQSVWYYNLTNQRYPQYQTFTGSCASWASDPVAAAYKAVAGWPNWKCADLPSNTQSMWFVIGQGVRTAQKYKSNCASYAR